MLKRFTITLYLDDRIPGEANLIQELNALPPKRVRTDAVRRMLIRAIEMMPGPEVRKQPRKRKPKRAPTLSKAKRTQQLHRAIAAADSMPSVRKSDPPIPPGPAPAPASASKSTSQAGTDDTRPEDNGVDPLHDLF